MKKMISRIKVIIDDREINCATVNEFKKIEGLEIIIKRLPLGDYEIDGNLLFERKTFPGLIASIKDGRLFRQACKLASSTIRSVIILEGTARELVASKMRREAIQGALVSLSIVLGIPLLRSKNPQETVKLMLYAAQQVRTVMFGAIPRHVKRPQGKRKIQLYFLQGLPGVGPQRAQRMLDKFGSIESVITASQQDLMKIPGIGQRLAGTIRGIVT